MVDANLLSRFLLKKRKEFELLERLEDDMSISEAREIVNEFQRSYPDTIVFLDIDFPAVFMWDGNVEFDEFE